MRNKIWMKSLCCGIILLLIATTVVSGSIIHNPRPSSTISISGTLNGLSLNGSGAVPVEGVQVIIIGGKIFDGITFAIQRSTPSDANGYYSLSDIPLGIFLMFARKPGEYLPGLRLVQLTSSQPIKYHQNISMIRIG
jgi:hypothetical protein